MAHYKNRRPKRITGCCTSCSGRGHDLGLRTKRLPSIQERRHSDVDDDVGMYSATVYGWGLRQWEEFEDADNAEFDAYWRSPEGIAEMLELGWPIEIADPDRGYPQSRLDLWP